MDISDRLGGEPALLVQSSGGSQQKEMLRTLPHPARENAGVHKQAFDSLAL